MGQSATLAIALTGLVLSYVAFVSVRDQIASDVAVAFERTAAARTAAIQRSIDEILFLTRAVSGLFAASQTVESHEFARFVLPLLSKDTDVQAVVWAPRVKANQRQAFETAGDLDFPGFQITQRANQRQAVRAQDRPEYFPVFYLVPYTGNQTAIGLDLASESAPAIALESARDTARMTASAPSLLMSANADDASVLLFQAVYKKNTPLDTVALRRANLLGVVATSFSVSNLVEQSLRYLRPGGVDILVEDHTSADSPNVLHFHPSRTRGVSASQTTPVEKPLRTGLRMDRDLSIEGRKWSLTLTPAPGKFGTWVAWQAWTISAGVLILTLLLLAYLQRLRKADARLRAANHELERLSNEDGLTGIANRRRFDDYLRSEWKRGARQKSPLSLIIADLDHFKAYNDRNGHLAGDRCLRQVAKTIKTTVERPADLAARYGGEELAIVMPDTPPSGAAAIAQQIQKVIESLAIPHKTSDASSFVTLSMGLGTTVPSHKRSLDDFVEAVDVALYQAKRKGRNRSEAAQFDNITAAESFERDHRESQDRQASRTD